MIKNESNRIVKGINRMKDSSSGLNILNSSNVAYSSVAAMLLEEPFKKQDALL